MEISRLAEEAANIAHEYGLAFVEVDRTDNTINLRLRIDDDKLGLALVFKKRRLYGYDSEGGAYHCHSFEADREVLLWRMWCSTRMNTTASMLL